MRLPALPRTLVGGLCLALAAASGYGGYTWAESHTAGPPNGTNVLVVGNDSREGVTKAQKRRWKAGGTACHCADVLMVVHLSENGRRASVVSLPRDSYVRFARHRDGGRWTSHHGKINAARLHGGRDLMLRTVQRATGLKIHHYVEARISGFVPAVDALGGATVCSRKPMRDEYSGIDLPAGKHHLGGVQSLQYVRTRHSGHGDIDRVRRQQRLVADIVGRHMAEDTFDDRDDLRDLVWKVARGLRPGPRTTRADMVALAYRARDLRLRDVEFATVPLSSIGYPTGSWGSAVKWDDDRARKMFARIRDDRRLKPGDRRTGPGTFDWKGRVAPGHAMDCR